MVWAFSFLPVQDIDSLHFSDKITANWMKRHCLRIAYPRQTLLVENSLYPCDAKVGRGAPATSLHIFDSDVAVCTTRSSPRISPEEGQIVPL